MGMTEEEYIDAYGSLPYWFILRINLF
jgi:hypothetical protein